MNVLYEDNHVIVAVKPQNVPSQADSSGDMDFLSEAREYVRVKYQKPGAAYLGLVHRLDRPAGGVMVFARTSKAAARLQKQLMDGSFQKEYIAVAKGEAPNGGTLINWLKKDAAKNTSVVVPEGASGAKYAELSYQTLKQNGAYRLLRIGLITGRPHQIRVQLQNAGAPLVGDFRYGGEPYPSLCLWAREVRFIHPVKKEEMAFSCAPPEYFESFFK